MMSFIIIGRNEGWKLSKCLESVFKTIKNNGLTAYEVLYVDSKSTDNSIENAKESKDVKAIQLTGDINAAIARNVGAKEAKGDVLYFIDGDMELNPEFLPLVYSEKNGLSHGFVSGNWINNNYSVCGKLINKDTQYRTDKDIIAQTTGGLILIEKVIWDSIGGMYTVFKKSQDIDLGFRLAKQGVHLVRKKEIAANHHTVAYLDKKRIWKDFFKWNHLYGRSLLYRKNICNKYMYKRMIRSDYSMLFLLICILTLFFYDNLLLMISYIIVVMVRSKTNINKTIFYIMRDISVLIGFFVFFPKEPANNKYVVL